MTRGIKPAFHFDREFRVVCSLYSLGNRPVILQVCARRMGFAGRAPGLGVGRLLGTFPIIPPWLRERRCPASCWLRTTWTFG
jgi:hypothetical protein